MFRDALCEFATYKTLMLKGGASMLFQIFNTFNISIVDKYNYEVTRLFSPTYFNKYLYLYLNSHTE